MLASESRSIDIKSAVIDLDDVLRLENWLLEKAKNAKREENQKPADLISWTVEFPGHTLRGSSLKEILEKHTGGARPTYISAHFSVGFGRKTISISFHHSLYARASIDGDNKGGWMDRTRQQLADLLKGIEGPTYLYRRLGFFAVLAIMTLLFFVLGGINYLTSGNVGSVSGLLAAFLAVVIDVHLRTRVYPAIEIAIGPERCRPEVKYRKVVTALIVSLVAGAILIPVGALLASK